MYHPWGPQEAQVQAFGKWLLFFTLYHTTCPSFSGCQDMLIYWDQPSVSDRKCTVTDREFKLSAAAAAQYMN